MTPQAQATAPTASRHDRLATLAGSWRNLLIDGYRPDSPAPFGSVRDELNELALEAEVADQNPRAEAWRRVALLTEVCECLESEPDQARAAADFCLAAIERLVHDWKTGGDDRRIMDEILRESDERWGVYLSQIDPTSGGRNSVDDPAPADEDDLLTDDAPAALDQAALLRLLRGAGNGRDHPAEQEIPSEPPRIQASRRQLTTEAESSPSAPDRPAEAVENVQTPGVKFPPPPARFQYDDEIKEAFLEDAVELFERIERIVIGLGGPADPREPIQELARCFHTLKGAAGSVGLTELADLVHELEEQLGRAGGGVSPELSDVLHQFVDYLDGIIGWLRRPPVARDVSKPAGLAPSVALGTTAVPSRVVVEAVAVSRGPAEEGVIRVPAARFDELADLASELIMQGRFWLSQAESMKTLATTARDVRGRLLGSVDRLRDAAPRSAGWTAAGPIDHETDVPAQLRRLEEHVDDLAVLAASAAAAAGPMADRADTLDRLSRQLWDSFQSLRIVPIRGLFQRLARVLHEAARVEERQVEVVMKGEETGVDRATRDQAFEPLLHVVRNAVGHGIESPSDRVRAGKPATGRVTLEAGREGDALVIVVSDDGKGLDEEAVAAKARKLGWLRPDETPSRERLHAFLFQPGFSTKSQANSISGRGVGMDVVAREIERLRGVLDLTSEPARGTRLTIRLPAQQGLEPALIVRVSGQLLAVPASRVEHALPYEVPDPDATREVGAEPAPLSFENASVNYRGQTIPVVFADEMLGFGRARPEGRPRLALVRTGRGLIGLVVDEIQGAEDLVVKPLSALLAGHPLVAGTSLSTKGEVISVIHPSGLERWLNDRESAGWLNPPRGAPARRASVLVVDDSISVRRVVARQLGDLGLEVHEVSNGLEALARLRDSRFDLVVTDLEMPKLDGFALLAEMKRSAALSSIPVIAASTRRDPETRRRLLELGARALLCKPVEPWELARVVKPLLTAIDG